MMSVAEKFKSSNLEDLRITTSAQGTWDGTGTEVAFVVSVNLHRRHLTTAQRAMVAAKIANMPLGGAVYRGGTIGVSIETPIAETPLDRASEMMNVSRASTARARRVLDHGEPELVAAVVEGRAKLHSAAIVRPRDGRRQPVGR